MVGNYGFQRLHSKRKIALFPLNFILMKSGPIERIVEAEDVMYCNLLALLVILFELQSLLLNSLHIIITHGGGGFHFTSK